MYTTHSTETNTSIHGLLFSAAIRGVLAGTTVPVLPVLPVGVLSRGGVNTPLPDAGLPSTHGDKRGDTWAHMTGVQTRFEFGGAPMFKGMPPTRGVWGHAPAEKSML